MQQVKSIFASTTAWFGLAQIVAGILGAISQKMDQETAIALVVTGLGTVGFRFKTDSPVTLTGK